MAGILTHLYIGNEILNKQGIRSLQIRNYFLLGNFMPDAAYWPRENQLFSDLSHYLAAARIPELLSNKAPDENWRAFARGWLLHLKTDLELHPMINEFAARYYYGENYSDQVMTYEMDQQIHALIENGLDQQLLRSINSEKILFLPPEINRNFKIADILNEIYPVDFSNTEVFDLITKSSSRLKFFYKTVLNLNKHKIVKLLLWKLIKLFRVFLAKPKYQLFSSFFDPYNFEPASFDKYLSAVEILIEKESSMKNPHWFEASYNFDTGGFSRLGEYGLADKLFTDLNKMDNNAPLIWSEFKHHFLNNKEY